MTDYETLKQRLENIRLEILKDKITGGIDLKRKLLSDGRTKVITILQQINDAIDISVRKLIASYGLDAKYLNAAPDLGFKQISYDFNDSTMSLQGLDGVYHDVPSFPQMKITDEDRQLLIENSKRLSDEINKRRVVIRCLAEHKTYVGDPDAEDSVYAYYYPQDWSVLELRDIDYEAITGQSPLTFTAQTYFAIDMEIPRVLRLRKVYAQTVNYTWVGGAITAYIDIAPSIQVEDPDNENVKRTTTASYIVWATNTKSANVELLIDSYVIPLPANKKVLVMVGGEMTGISGTLTIFETSV